MLPVVTGQTEGCVAASAVIGFSADEEAQKVMAVDDVIVDISEMLPLEEVYGEFTGIAKVERERVEAFRQAMFECVKRDSNLVYTMIFGHLEKRGTRSTLSL